jgi:hypothetical protein
VSSLLDFDETSHETLAHILHQYYYVDVDIMLVIVHILFIIYNIEQVL